MAEAQLSAWPSTHVSGRKFLGLLKLIVNLPRANSTSCLHRAILSIAHVGPLVCSGLETGTLAACLGLDGDVRDSHGARGLIDVASDP